MKAKKYMAMIAAGSVMVTSIAGGEVSMAAMEQETVIEAAEETDMLKESAANLEETVVIASENTEDEKEEEDTDEDEVEEEPEITNLKAEFNERTNQITLNWEMTANTSAKIYVNNELAEEECKRNAYVYDVPYEGMNYEFEVIPYIGEEQGESEKISISVGYKRAVLEDVDVEYDLDKKILSVEWNGESIKYADVYQDDVKIAEKITDSRFVSETSLEPLSKHVYKVIPYNGNQEAGDEKTVELQVDDYTAKITEYDIEYDEENKKIVMEWDAVHTSGVVICINEEEVEGEYKSDKYVLNYQLQSGAKYQVTITPYNQNGNEGAAVTTTLQNGEFETPTIDDLQEKSIPVTDEKGNYTGFHKPVVEVIWEGEANGTYELYRAEKDKKSAYTYVAAIKSQKDGVCTYTDKNVGVGDYYYKIRKVIKEDTYITQEIATSLSESMVIGIELPKTVLQAELAEDNMVLLTLDGKKDYVSGYEIYRKSGNGKYKKIAAITENTYLDEKVDFETLYKYKARAYYYDKKTGKKKYGPYSAVVSAKNTLGNVKVKVTALSKNKVKISWNKVANAEGYEVYYKSDVQGDGYTLLKDTKKLSLTQTLESGKEYSFLIKAYRKKETGETYFSSDKVTYKTGFSKPKGFKIRKTEYEFKKESNTLVQKDTLSWKQVYGAKGYYIEAYNETTKKYETIAKIKKAATTEYTLENVVSKDAKEVKYRISAYNGKKVLSGGTINIKPQLGTVSGVKVKASESKVSLSWNSVRGAEKYNVYRSNGRNMVLLGTTEKLKFADKGLSIGVTYTYYVQPVNETMGCTGSYSKEVYCKIPLEKVTKVTAVNSESAAVTLKWSKVSNADGYMIYCAEKADGFYQKIAEVKGNNNRTYTHKKLEKNTSYFYKVVAFKVNEGGVKNKSEDSKIVQVEIEK